MPHRNFHAPSRREDTHSTISELTLDSTFDNLSVADNVELDNMGRELMKQDRNSSSVGDARHDADKNQGACKRCCRSRSFRFCCCIFVILPLLVLLGVLLFVFIFPLTLSELDTVWEQYLDDPPDEVTTLRAELMARAVTSAEGVLDDPNYNLDVVCAGGGFLSFYFSGVYSILRLLEEDGKLSLNRYSGASAGAQVSFMNVLMANDNMALDRRLSYGYLQVSCPTHMREQGAERAALWRAERPALWRNDRRFGGTTGALAERPVQSALWRNDWLRARFSLGGEHASIYGICSKAKTPM